jgi:hypothetical protein
MFMESVIYGNVDRNQVIELINIFEKLFLVLNEFRELLPRLMVRSKEVQLENREDTLFKTTSDHHSSSSVIDFQCGAQST